MSVVEVAFRVCGRRVQLEFEERERERRRKEAADCEKRIKVGTP